MSYFYWLCAIMVMMMAWLLLEQMNIVPAFNWVVFILIVLSCNCCFAFLFYKNIWHKWVQLKEGKPESVPLYIVPGLVPPKGMLFCNYLKDYRELLRDENEDYQGDVYILQDRDVWSPFTIGPDIIDHARRCDYRTIRVLDISVGCHTEVPLNTRGIKVEVYHFNPCSNRAIQGFGPVWLRTLFGGLAYLFFGVLGPLGSIRFLQLGDSKGTLGFFLSQIADIYTNARITTQHVKGIVLSNQDEFFGVAGNDFLRDAFSQLLPGSFIITIGASHADIAQYHDAYHGTLRWFNFFER